MASTSYTDPTTAWAAYALQDRTDESGSAVDDLNGEDMRIVLEAFTAGVLSADAFQVREDSPTPGMTVRVGSGAAKSDVAILEGTEAGQGKYMVRLGDAATTVTVPAAHVSHPRIDEVYLVVQDDPYDSNGANTVPRIGYRQGDAASNPSAPGPDGSWTAYLKLASIDVAAGTTEIEAGDITDERVFAAIGVDVVDVSAVEVDEASEVLTSVLSPDTTTTVATVSLPIPASWNSWKCVAYATMVGLATGSIGRVTVWIRIDGVDQPVHNVDLSLSRMSIGVGGRRTGITTTGTRSVSVQANSNITAALRDIFLYVRAVRTS